MPQPTHKIPIAMRIDPDLLTRIDSFDGNRSQSITRLIEDGLWLRSIMEQTGMRREELVISLARRRLDQAGNGLKND